MRILVCVKRVPATGGQIVLTADARDIDTRFLGFTISPHEECAVEEAVRIVEAQGGTTAVLTLYLRRFLPMPYVLLGLAAALSNAAPRSSRGILPGRSSSRPEKND